ncbi:phytanoyl-CoA dioxygenase family protein [Neptunicoccus cionae]|uniref:Phytanoyl-CoA dioxygenase n=1 Tax=Neptunicoccus cionae TaxID=2035344 RepID=A0A916R143_9RHOB|nr:phytanoyl-CoA dioxygenase family protein [Amylibacter cionae]GGA29508.1 hypothetical protein GCM10011498_33370 [Amylibacter cionae]
MSSTSEHLSGTHWGKEKNALDQLGYTAPLPLSEPERVAAVLAENADRASYTRNPHSSSATVRHMLSDPGLVKYVTALCGPNLRLWRSAFFSKSEGSGEIGWHHDKHFFSNEAEDIRLDEIGSHYSVLFGLTQIDQTTGMLEVLTATHQPMDGLERDSRPYHKRPANEHILTDLPDTVLSNRRPIPIPANSFLIFHSALLHHSLPHNGGGDRLGLAIRLVAPDLVVPAELADAKDVMSFPPAP